ncbi:putative membrane protein [Novipirellula galeiformis]|uniref:Putative membrane protein n=1 Tax=Novipirellula galeiformis TaxID=2528004 RepID=A0A5C6CEU1_9BACT|nr:tellurite resistance/C4-dicarboxylate transporter family protein [Novipirellula galeiformis]TWU22034.1 putative membrane protein [Novipirellula galeiformis]
MTDTEQPNAEQRIAEQPIEKSSAWQRHTADLDPACFSMVMATGIVSLACWQYRSHASLFGWTAVGLLGINVAAFAILVMLTTLRVVLYWRQLAIDAAEPTRGFGFFSTVAASCVLGSQFLLIAEQRGIAMALWCFAIFLWFLLTYTIFACVTVKSSKPKLAVGLHGGWLLAVVATQSVSLLGALLAMRFPGEGDWRLFFSLVLWLGGGMLYGWIISLIFYRYCFEPIDVDSMSPPYWINMGAMAISTLAGVALLAASGESTFLASLLPFIKGVTLLCWATATWWIPLLVVLGFWRHAYKRVRLEYDLRYWSIVFPLGMYSVGTHQMLETLELPFLRPLAMAFAYLACAAWAAASMGWIRTQSRTR